jgi:lysine 2,3-aminomutase
MEYFEQDAQLRDILVTGGDALMSSDETLRGILDAIYQMARLKRQANRSRPDGEKYAEILRVRLGTRIPVYLPQRVTPEIADLLAAFREKAGEIGIRQFVIQTHFESPMEVTPESQQAIARLIGAGWTVTNQLVFTSAASRRGHTAKLRQVLEKIGVLPYYTFVVKGYMENRNSYAPIARIVQEAMEEKFFGSIPEELHEEVGRLSTAGEAVVGHIEKLRQEADLPFLSTDRSVLNLPAVGKSLTFRVIGITRYGRRILEFDHDPTRSHSPIIGRMGKVVVIESKSVEEYLQQLDEMGEDLEPYSGLYGYSLGETEPRLPIFEYPTYDFRVTEDFTNLEIPA